jgi:5-methylcytosine-specific restriction endonuclease McrA
MDSKEKVVRAPQTNSPRTLRGRARLMKVLRERDKGICQICHLPVREAGGIDNDAPSIDHIAPRARGGSDALHNLQLVHFGCNRSKRDRGYTPRELAARRAVATRQVRLIARAVE